MDSGELKQFDGFWYHGDQIAVPRPAREAAVSACHDTVYSGHFGVVKTQRLVARQFWWPGMGKDMQEFCASCPTCQMSKSRRKKPAGLLVPLPVATGPWTTVTMDFVTDLPRTQGGHDALCVFVDKLTKMVRVVPTHSDVDAAETADIFVNYIFRYHGLPRQIISDRGTVFMSQFFQQLLKSF